MNSDKPFRIVAVSSWRTKLGVLCRLRPLEPDTHGERSHERHRRIALSTLAALGAKGASTLAALITVPLTLHYLGPERYGIWMTMTSVMLMLVFADLGLGNGLLNAISEANGKDDRAMALRLVSSAFFMLLMVAGILGAAFAACIPTIDWSRLLNLRQMENRSEVVASMWVLGSFFVLNIPLGIGERVRLGYQEAFLNSIYQVGGSILGLGCILLVIQLRGGLPWLALALAGPPVVASLGNCFSLFYKDRLWLRPRWHQANWNTAKSLLRLGTLFFILQIAASVAFASDNLILTHIMGPEAVTDLSVPARLFSLVPLLLGLALAPLWSAYSEAMARGDYPWVVSTLRKAFLGTLVMGVAAASALVIFGKVIVRTWVGPQVHVPFSLLLGLGAWAVMMSTGNVIATWLNAVNIFWPQVAMALSMALVSVVLKVALTHWCGVSGIAWGMVLAYGVCVGLPYCLYVPRWLKSKTQANAAR